MELANFLQWTTGRPVETIDIEFRWQEGTWRALFDAQVNLIQEDIDRARAEDKLIWYLSCPISSRGGGFHGTNIDIAKFTEHRLLMEWGERIWILNPCQYQMESKEGLGLIHRHARELGIDISSLKNLPAASGGDYMRMWTRVLCEDWQDDAGKRIDAGLRFDAFYFLGPTDVRQFFTGNGQHTVTAGIEEYFARKLAAEPDFCDWYSVPGIEWRPDSVSSPPDLEAREAQRKLRVLWEAKRRDFFRFYAVRASVNYSLGSHDEWNIFRLANARRRSLSARSSDMPNGDIGDQIAGFFDGHQIDPSAAETPLSKGYAV